jgi:hypothetical protein
MLSTLLGSFTIHADAPADDAKGVDKGAEGAKDVAETETAEEEAEEPEDVSSLVSGLEGDEFMSLSYFFRCLFPVSTRRLGRLNADTRLRRRFIPRCGTNAPTQPSASDSRSTLSIVRRRFMLERGSRVRIALRKCELSQSKSFAESP